MQRKRLSVYELLRQKGRRKWLHVHVDSAAEAAAAEEAGVEILACESDHRLELIRAAAPFAYVSAGIPHHAIATPQEAVRFGLDTLARGADAVYTAHSPQFIEAMAREGIPVTAHVGLVPDRAAWTGMRCIGKTPEEALKVWQAAKDLENAGAACVEVEVVPVQLADFITRNTRMITMGMGCGDVCDTQYLWSCDILGTNRGRYPRHAKKYADFAALEDELQQKRVAAFKAFADDVAQGAFPRGEHAVQMEADALDRFLALSKT
jgi:3-methyl-2-oxobutanoate hydroxymethyltransferase